MAFLREIGAVEKVGIILPQWPQRYFTKVTTLALKLVPAP